MSLTVNFPVQLVFIMQEPQRHHHWQWIKIREKKLYVTGLALVSDFLEIILSKLRHSSDQTQVSCAVVETMYVAVEARVFAMQLLIICYFLLYIIMNSGQVKREEENRGIAYMCEKLDRRARWWCRKKRIKKETHNQAKKCTQT